VTGQLFQVLALLGQPVGCCRGEAEAYVPAACLRVGDGPGDVVDGRGRGAEEIEDAHAGQRTMPRGERATAPAPGGVGGGRLPRGRWRVPVSTWSASARQLITWPAGIVRRAEARPPGYRQPSEMNEVHGSGRPGRLALSCRRGGRRTAGHRVPGTRVQPAGPDRWRGCFSRCCSDGSASMAFTISSRAAAPYTAMLRSCSNART
jgi:hypothetical protein